MQCRCKSKFILYGLVKRLNKEYILRHLTKQEWTDSRDLIFSQVLTGHTKETGIHLTVSERTAYAKPHQPQVLTYKKMPGSAAFNGHMKAAAIILAVAPHLIASKDFFER